MNRRSFMGMFGTATGGIAAAVAVPAGAIAVAALPKCAETGDHEFMWVSDEPPRYGQMIKCPNSVCRHCGLNGEDA